MPHNCAALRGRSRRMAGVTLIELMIAVACVGILAAIAYPSYRSYVMRANRVDATAALLQLAAAQEKFYLQNNRYSSNAATLLGRGVATSERGYYTIAINPAPDYSRGYTATATAASSQAQAGDTRCSSFSITHTGIRSASTDDCWK